MLFQLQHKQIVEYFLAQITNPQIYQNNHTPNSLNIKTYSVGLKNHSRSRCQNSTPFVIVIIT